MSPKPSFDVSANHRTKEENQERAFIAASRRKDRSLDARIESANRASALHKNRTGRALHITRQIVESEAMYEEVDSNYQAKLQRMMQAQTLQLEQDFERKLFVAMRNNPQALHQRRASSSLASQGPMHGARRMSLDLSQLRTTLPEALTSPLAGCHFSPRYSIASTGPHLQGPAPAQVPAYVASGTPTWVHPEHPQLMQPPPPWDGLYGGPLSPSAMGGLPTPAQPFRDRLASAPTIPVHAIAAASRGPSQHLRVWSEPGITTLPNSTPLSATSSTSSSSSSFQVEPAPYATSPSLDPSSCSDLLPTPDPCTSPHTPASQVSEPSNNFSSLDLANLGHGGPEKWNTDLMHEIDLNMGFGTFPHEPADQDYLDFSQFASTLDHGHIAPSQAHAQMQVPLQMPVPLDMGGAPEPAMDGLPDMDEYTANL
ncbi:hypothetical protein BJX63DRAFT_436671 [Aspergillus granulosus]|uniref:BZIP domain-containing protein n=1 Tax=Aspergillus granulosus TaxID=176169 RepID=A0ABR4GZ13_9EURO